jgi:Transcription factor WhiB
MAVSRIPAPADYGPGAPAVGGVTDGPPSPPAAIPSTDRALWVRVIRHARCTGSSLDPDQWFPVSVEADKARLEAAAAITLCTTCLVRAECLALALRHWDVGQHGVWGGLVAAERAALRRPRHATVLRTVQHAPLADGTTPDVDADSSLAGGPRKRFGGARDHAAAAAVAKAL